MACLLLVALIAACAASCSRRQSNGQESQEIEKELARGNKLLDEGNFNQALEAYYKVVRDAEADSVSHAPQLMDAYLGSGSVDYVYGDYTEALASFKRGLAIAQALDSVNKIAKLRCNILGIMVAKGELDSAAFYNESLKCLPNFNQPTWHSRYFYNAALLDMNRGNLARAMELARRADSILRRARLPESERIHIPLLLGYLHEESGQPDSAMRYYQEYEQMAQRSGKLYMLSNSYRQLLNLHMALNNTDQVVKYQALFFKLTDSAMNSVDYQHIKSSQKSYERQVERHRIDSLNATVRKQKALFWSAVVLAVAGAGIWAARRKRRKKQPQDSLSPATPDEQPQDSLSPATPDEQPQQPALSPEPDEPRLMANIREIMRDTSLFCDPAFSLKRLAELANSNSTYVSQIINETQHKNFRTWLNDYRIEDACRKMALPESDNLTIQAIAESVGILSPSNFISAFKRKTGLTPSAYLQQLRSRPQ